MTSVSGSIREQLLVNLNDRELTKKEYNSLKEQFLKTNPVLKAEDFDTELTKTLSGLNDKNSATELSKKVKELSSSTEVNNISLFFDKNFQAQIKNDDIKINVNLNIEDADGLANKSKNDLSGELSGTVKVSLDKNGMVNKNLGKYFMKLEPETQADGKTKYNLSLSSMKVGSISVENGKMTVHPSKVSSTLLSLTDKIGYKDEALNYFSKAFKEATGVTLKPREVKDGDKTKFVMDVEQFTLRGNLDTGSFNTPNESNKDNLPSEIRMKPTTNNFSFAFDNKAELKVTFDKVKLEGDSDSKVTTLPKAENLNPEKVQGDLTIRLNADAKTGIKAETVKFNNFKAELSVNDKLLKNVSDNLKKGDKIFEKQLEAVGVPKDIINKLKDASSNEVVKELLHNQSFMDKLKTVKLNVQAESLVIDTNDTNITAKANNLNVSSDIKGEAFLSNNIKDSLAKIAKKDSKFISELEGLGFSKEDITLLGDKNAPKTQPDKYKEVTTRLAKATEKNKQSEAKLEATANTAVLSKSVLSTESLKETQDTLNSTNKEENNKLTSHLKKSGFSETEIAELKNSNKKALENLTTSANIVDILGTDDKYKSFLTDKGLEFLAKTLNEKVENKFSFIYGEKTKVSPLAKKTNEELLKSGLSKEQIEFLKDNAKNILPQASFANKINNATATWSASADNAQLKVSLASENREFAKANFEAKNIKAGEKLADKNISMSDFKSSGQLELDHDQLKRLGNSLSQLGKEVVNHLEKLGLKEENFKAIIDKINFFSKKGSVIKDTATKISKDLKIPEAEVKNVLSLLENKDFQALLDNIENTRAVIANAKSTGKISAEFSSSLIKSELKDQSLTASAKKAVLNLHANISSPQGRTKGDLNVNWNNLNYVQDGNNKQLNVGKGDAKMEVIAQEVNKNPSKATLTSKTEGATFTKKGSTYDHSIKATSFNTDFVAKSGQTRINSAFDAINSKGLNNKSDNSNTSINNLRADSTAVSGNRYSKIDVNTDKILFDPKFVNFGKTQANADIDRIEGASKLKANVNIDSEGLTTSEKTADLKATTANVKGNLDSPTSGKVDFSTKAVWDGQDFKFNNLNSKFNGLSMETFKSLIKMNPNGKKLLETVQQQGLDFNGKKVDLNISNTNIDKGVLSGKVALDNLKTTLGNAEVSLNLKNVALEGKSESEVKGSINLNIDSNEINKLINSKIKELQKAGKLPESFKIDAKFENGKIKTNADTWYAGAEAGITVTNNKLVIDIEKAKLLGIFSVRGLSADKVRESLQKEGINISQDKRTLTLDVKQLFSKYVNDSTEISNANIKGNQLSFDFKYKE